MESVMEERIHVNGYDLHLIRNQKFKTNSMVAKFKAPLQRETITNRALLPYILRQGSKSYPDRLTLQKKLDDLYGAVLRSEEHTSELQSRFDLVCRLL